MDQAYATWAGLPDGAVHFEAGLAALMVPNQAEAALRLERAVRAARPQPMAWNSLAILHLVRGDRAAAQQAIEAGLLAMPGDTLTARTAGFIKEGQTPATLTLMLERFPGHAQLARDADGILARLPEIPGLDVASARRLLAQRAEALDGTATKGFFERLKQLFT